MAAAAGGGSKPVKSAAPVASGSSHAGTSAQGADAGELPVTEIQVSLKDAEIKELEDAKSIREVAPPKRVKSKDAEDRRAMLVRVFSFSRSFRVLMGL